MIYLVIDIWQKGGVFQIFGLPPVVTEIVGWAYDGLDKGAVWTELWKALHLVLDFAPDVAGIVLD